MLLCKSNWKQQGNYAKSVCGFRFTLIFILIISKEAFHCYVKNISQKLFSLAPLYIVWLVSSQPLNQLEYRTLNYVTYNTIFPKHVAYS